MVIFLVWIASILLERKVNSDVMKGYVKTKISVESKFHLKKEKY